MDPPLALVLQEPDRPCQRPPRTRRTGERVDLAPRLSPDLGTGRLDVRLSVGDVVELVRPYGILQTIRIPLGLMVIILGVIESYRGDGPHIRPEHPEEIDLFLTLRVGHVDDTFVPL